MEGSQTTTLATATTEIRQKPKEPAEAELGSEVAFDTANSGLGLAIQGSQTEVQVQDYDGLYQECIQARDALIDTANKYRKKSNLPPIDGLTNHSWQEVDEGVHSTCSELEKIMAQDRRKATGSIGRLREAFRALCRHAGIGQTVLSLIPGDAFGFSTSLCAGFKVIFTAMQQTALYRDELLRALAEIPYLIKDSSELCSSLIFQDDSDLHQRRADLLTAVFQALRHILFWFVKNSFVKSVKMLIDPEGFAQRLQERVDDVKLRHQLFKSQAMKLSLLLQAQSARLQYETTREVQDIAIRAEVIETRTQVIEAEMMETKIATLDMLEKLDSLVRSSLSTKEAPRTLPSLKPKLAAAGRRKSPSNNMIEDIILCDFCYDSEMMPTDCGDILRILLPSRRPNSTKDFDEQRVVAIQSNPRIRAWLVLAQPSMLLVNGRTSSQPRSEVSVVSAKVAKRLLELHESQRQMGNSLVQRRASSPVVIPLIFFCGQHRDWRRDPNGNPSELAMSLLLQLVDRGREVLPAAALQRFRQVTNPEKISSICSSLRALIGSLKSNAFVVIIIDGLKFFSQPEERHEQTRDVVSRLVSLFRDRPTDATLKFLFMSTTRSESLEDLFEDDESSTFRGIL